MRESGMMLKIKKAGIVLVKQNFESHIKQLGFCSKCGGK